MALKKRKKRIERSPRQQWVSERKWFLFGNLGSMLGNIRKVLGNDSLLPDEQFEIHQAEVYLDKALRKIRGAEREEESYKLFCKRRGFIK